MRGDEKRIGAGGGGQESDALNSVCVLHGFFFFFILFLIDYHL